MRFLVFQHVDVEHPGIFRDFMHAEKIQWDVVQFDQSAHIPRLDDYAALLVMGGPMDVWQTCEHPWLVAEKAAIAEWVERRQRPYLGVCLGHQLLAAALGGEVGIAAKGEVGVMPVTLNERGRSHPFFASAPAQFNCLQWHGAEVTRPPLGADVLASSADCAIQALALGRHAFSFQFHVEVIGSTVDDWNTIPAYQRSLEVALGAHGADAFRAQAAANMPDFNRLARQLYDNWRSSAFA